MTQIDTNYFTKFEDDELSTLANCLGMAVERFTKDAEEFEALEAHLKKGLLPPPMFAGGEAGAFAARRLAAQFRRQAQEAEAMQSRVQDARDEDEDEDW